MLNEIYKNSNRDQAAHIPVKLALIGCDLAAAEDVGVPFQFQAAEIDRLAQLEHDRFVDERRLTEPDHPALRPWEKLPAQERQKDIDMVEVLPALLSEVGLGIVRR